MSGEPVEISVDWGLIFSLKRERVNRPPPEPLPPAHLSLDERWALFMRHKPEHNIGAPAPAARVLARRATAAALAFERKPDRSEDDAHLLRGLGWRPSAW